MFRKKVLLSTAVVMAVLGGRESAEAQTSAGKSKKFTKNLAEKLAIVSPKLTSNDGNSLINPFLVL